MPDRCVPVPADLLERLQKYADEVYENWSYEGEARSGQVWTDSEDVRALLSVPAEPEMPQRPDLDEVEMASIRGQAQCQSVSPEKRLPCVLAEGHEHAHKSALELPFGSRSAWGH
jgi:hypothetical protein